MIENGYFETIIHFKETPIFDNVASSIIIFKYIKSSKKPKPYINYTEYDSRVRLSDKLLSQLKNFEDVKDCKYFQLKQFQKDSKWLFADEITLKLINDFEEHCLVQQTNKNLFNTSSTLLKLGDIARIGNGMVSGLDKAFQLPNEIELNEEEKSSTILVSKAKHLSPYYVTDTVRYIFITSDISEEVFKKNYPNFYKHLFPFIENLEKRYKYNRQINYWEWVFLRNYQTVFSQNKHKIFIPCKERISHKNHLRFAFAEHNILPTQDVTAIYFNEDINESIYYILALLNNHRVFHWLKYNGIIKGNILEFSEKPTSQIPIKLINWKNDCEVQIHNKITTLVKEYIDVKNNNLLKDIDCEIDKLFKC
jgi:adenine-specific DNA-methyltransferase